MLSRCFLFFLWGLLVSPRVSFSVSVSSLHPRTAVVGVNDITARRNGANVFTCGFFLLFFLSLSLSHLLPQYVNMWQRSAAVVAVLACLMLAGVASASSNPLGPYPIDLDRVTVGGLSSGGFMAVQVHVALSSMFKAGASVFAGGPYGCAVGNVVSVSKPVLGSEGCACEPLPPHTHTHLMKVFLLLPLTRR